MLAAAEQEAQESGSAQSSDAAKSESTDFYDCYAAEHAAILNNMAGTYHMMQQPGQAITLYEQAFELYQKAGGEQTLSCVGILNNLSASYRMLQEPETAIRMLCAALELLKTLPGHAAETARICSNLTTLYASQGMDAQAMLYLERALRAYECCPDEENTDYVSVLMSLAAYLLSKGEAFRALVLYRKSADYTLKHNGKTEEYGVVCQQMSRAYEQLGNPQKAVSALREAFLVFQSVFGTEHERTQSVLAVLSHLSQNKF